MLLVYPEDTFFKMKTNTEYYFWNQRQQIQRELLAGLFYQKHFVYSQILQICTVTKVIKCKKLPNVYKVYFGHVTLSCSRTESEFALRLRIINLSHFGLGKLLNFLNNSLTYISSWQFALYSAVLRRLPFPCKVMSGGLFGGNNCRECLEKQCTPLCKSSNI